MDMSSQPKPPYDLATERLLLRSARAGDGPALHDAIRVSLADFYPWLSFSAELSPIETMEEVSELGQTKFEEGEFYVWRVWNDADVMVGSVDLRPLDLSIPSYEIGYWLRSDHTGNGFATEFGGEARICAGGNRAQ